MIFEQAYGKQLTAGINGRIQRINENLICKLYDEIGYKPLQNNADEIALVISGGNASRSAVKGQDQNVLPLTVTIVCKEIYSGVVRNAVDDFQRDFNAVPLVLEYYDNVTKRTAVANYKAVYTTPLVFTHSDYATRNETIKAAFISFSASVIYGQTAVIEPTVAKLVIDGKEYEIDHIADCNMASMPSYEAYLPQGAERMRQADLSAVNAFSYTLYKVAGDELQKIFDNELECHGGGLHGKELSLRLYDDDGVKAETKISTYQLNYHYVNNAAAYVLTLGV